MEEAFRFSLADGSDPRRSVLIGLVVALAVCHSLCHDRGSYTYFSFAYACHLADERPEALSGLTFCVVHIPERREKRRLREPRLTKQLRHNHEQRFPSTLKIIAMRLVDRPCR